MLARYIVGYIPSLLVPAFTSFAAIYCYTRLLSPQEYGCYALSLSAMTLLNAVFFYWLQVALQRLMPQAIREGTATQLRVTVYIAFGVASVILVMCALPLARFLRGDLYTITWLAVPLALARSLLNLNQAFHRSALNFRRYNLIECGQAVLGLLAGLALVYFLHAGNRGAVLGLILGMGTMALIDARQWLSVRLKYFSKPMLVDIARFGLPLSVTYGLAFIVASSDRFLIEYFRGASEVGIYAAGFTLVERIITLSFMAVSLPSFPLAIHKLEHESMTAARQQTSDNGAMMLALTLPVCAGLILARQPLAASVIGSEFREGALRVMPWITMSAFFCGMAAHYFDHAFHLAKKPRLLFLTQGPAAIVNLAMNLILIPRYGYMGAAYASLSAYALLLMLSIRVGRRAFPLQFPVKEALRIAGAVAVMAIIIRQIPFSDTLPGLIAMAACGSIFYLGGLLLFNAMGVRTRIASRIAVISRDT